MSAELPEGFSELRSNCGVYVLLQDNEVVYIGKSKNVHTRIESHRNENLKVFNKVMFLEVAPLDLDNIEAELIIKYQPRYNKVTPIPTRQHEVASPYVCNCSLCEADRKNKIQFTPEYFNNMLISEGHGGNCDCPFCEGDPEPDRKVWITRA